MFQSWCDLTFLHWRYPVELVQERVAAPLRVESFDGSAWVGVIPFVVRDLRPPLLPAIPWISTFPETNCRTYVRAPDGSSGVWFFSLDAARASAVAGARLLYGLPYAWAWMRVERAGNDVSYRSERRWPPGGGSTSIKIRQGEAIPQGDLEIFLTARFRLYSFVLGRLTYADVEHEPWPLQSGEPIGVRQNLIEAAGLPRPGEQPLVHFSPGVRVRISRPRVLSG